MHYANILAFHQVHDSEEKGFLNKWRIFGSNQKWSATPWIILDFSAVGINFFTQAVTILQWFSAIIKSNRQIFSVSVHQVIFLFDFLKHFINIKVFDVYDNRGVDVLAVIRCSCGFLRYLGYCFAVCSGTELGVLSEMKEKAGKSGYFYWESAEYLWYLCRSKSWEYCFTKRKGFEWLCFVFTLAVLIWV